MKNKEPDSFRMGILANRCKESLNESKMEPLLVFAFDVLECGKCPTQQKCKNKENHCCVDELIKYLYRE